MERSKKHTTPCTEDKKQMEAAFQEYLSYVADCFGKPYDDRNYDEDNLSAQRDSSSLWNVEDSRKYRERRRTVEELQEKITNQMKKEVAGEIDRARINTAEINTVETNTAELDKTLWQCIIAFQNYPFYTSSGLPFSYTVKKKKNGEYSGELEISRKEGSKTLTRSSVLLAFHKVLEGIKIVEVTDSDSISSTALMLAEYKGPKAIGQIFGISYLYSLFWKWGLIKVPEKVENKLRGKGKA